MSIDKRSAGSGAFARRLLTTSSLVAFSAAASSQAHAVIPCDVINNTGSTASIALSNTSATGNVCNSGTVSPGGVVVTNSTLNGSILDSGTIAGGISVDGNSQINASLLSSAISVTGSSFAGGISNGGTINATQSNVAGSCANAWVSGINVAGVSSFAGGIQNGGTITAGATATASSTFFGCAIASASGVTVTGGGVETFAGGISNAGTITATATATSSGACCGSTSASAYGINVSNIAAFAGGITNGSRTISATATTTVTTPSAGGSACATANANAYGINVTNISTVAGGISNGGMIQANATATAADPSTSCRSANASASAYGINVANISTFSGGISNAGTISVGATAMVSSAATCRDAFANAKAYGINVSGTGVETFAGGIANNGTISATATATASPTSHACGATAGAGAYGINVRNLGTFAGGIANNGTVSATATATASSTTPFACVTANAHAYGINVSNLGTFSGGISNGGTISATANAAMQPSVFGVAEAYGINAAGVSIFSGGISNGGTITATGASLNNTCADAYGINVSFVSTFSGGITNSGTITASAQSCACAHAYGIRVDHVSSFSGGITNRGTITATIKSDCGFALAFGISVTNVSVFSGDINNQGTITANSITAHVFGGTSVGIYVNNVSTFTGRIINGGTITGDTGIVVDSVTPGISIFSSGTITGNCGTAIQFNNSGGNTLTLGPGFVMNGNVNAVAGDTFQLGGTGSGTFDLSTIGTQYNNFGIFNTISATWTATGVLGVSGFGWNVTGGTFLVNGDLTPAGSVSVTGGILGGTGDGTTTGLLPATTIGSGGTLMPGLPNTAGGLLTISTGNLTMNSGSLYLVNVGTGATGFTSATHVTNGGVAFLNAGSMIQVAGSGAYTSGAHYTVLTAAGGVTGSFSNPNNIALGHLGSMQAHVTYDAKDVFLDLVPLSLLSFLPAGASTNQVNVANAITGANTGTPPLAFQNLFSLSPQQLAAALTQLSGEVGTGAQESGIQLMNSFISLLSPSGLAQVGGTGAAMPFAPERDVFTPDISSAYASVMPTKAAVRAAAPRYNVWGAGYGGTTSVTGDAAGVGTHGLRDRAAGGAAGVDFRPDPATVVGFTLGGAGTSWDVSDGLGTGRTDAFQVGVYGSRQWGPAYLAGVLTFANYSATTDRTVTVAGTDHLTASFNAQGLAGRLEGGYRAWTMPVGVTPYAAVQAQYFHTPTYFETAASGSAQFALSFGAKDQTVVRTELGSWFDQIWRVGGMAQLKLFARAAWAHDFNNNLSLTNTFLGLPAASFVVNGVTPPLDLALATAGAEYRLPSGVSFMARFDGEFGKGSQTYTGTGRVKYEW